MGLVNILNSATVKAADFATITWFSDDASFSRSTTKHHSGFASLRITADAANGIIYSHDVTGTYLPSATPGEEYRGVMWVSYPHVGTQFTFTLSFYGSSGLISQVSDDFYIGYTPWKLLSVSGTAPANTIYAVLKLEYVDLDASDLIFYIDDPAIVTTEETLEAFTSLLAFSIPEYWTDLDNKQINPVRPLYSYLDLVGHQGDDVLNLFFNFGYIPPSEGGTFEDTSILVDPYNYPDSGGKPEWLTWLAQLCGVRKFDIPGTSNSWSSFDAYGTWDEWQTLINEASLPGSLSTSAIRSSGVVTATTATAHSLTVGDSIVIAGVTAANFNGIYEVANVLDSDEFTYLQQYAILAISRSGTTVTVKCGTPHHLSVADSVTVSGTGNAQFDGASFTVVSVSMSGDLGVEFDDVFTYSTVGSGTIAAIYNCGVTFPIDASSSVSGTMIPDSDLAWSYIESAVGTAFAQDEAIAYLIRTGATGIWAGTNEGMRRAGRIALSGLDAKVGINCSAGEGTATFAVPHGLTGGDWIEIYASTIDALNGIYSVSTVPNANNITFTCSGEDESAIAWVTTRDISIDKYAWMGTPLSIVVSAGVMTIVFSTKIPFDLTSGSALVAGTGTYDGAQAIASATISLDRYSLSFASGAAPGSISPSGSSVKITSNDPQEMFNCFVARTLASQTINPNTVVSFVEQAKPAGGVVTHQLK